MADIHWSMQPGDPPAEYYVLEVLVDAVRTPTLDSGPVSGQSGDTEYFQTNVDGGHTYTGIWVPFYYVNGVVTRGPQSAPKSIFVPGGGGVPGAPINENPTIE